MLITLLSTSFPSCLPDKTHQCGLSMAEYTQPWYPVQFPIDRRCSVPESWHTLFWWLFGSFLVFFPAKICLFQHRFCWRSDFCSVPLPGCNVSTNAVETQIANPNIDWLYLHMLHVPTVCVPFACTHMGRPISQSKSIHLSQSFVCLLSPSICVFRIFVYDVGTLPKTARVFMHMHMAAAIVEVPVCTASYLQLCSSKVPSQEKRKGKLALFYF